MNHRRLLLLAAGTALAGSAGLALSAPAGAAAAPTSAASLSAAPISAVSPQAAKCDAGPWADRIQGAPSGFAGGDRGGDYLWHDQHGMHLRVTHRSSSRDVYTGTITSSTAMRIDPVRLEKGDVARLSANHRTLVFAFSNYGHVDGVDFHADCATSITVAHLNEGNSVLPASRVYLGVTKAHPARVPFTVHRTA
jgi:hypothetical protein